MFTTCLRNDGEMKSVFLLAACAAATFAQDATRSCESLAELRFPNTTIESAAVDSGICRVNATVTHPPADDKVKVFLALPLKNWNGRFQGVGGGGFSGGNPQSVIGPAKQGYAAGATDTGHEGGSGSFALDANSRLNWMLIRDNAYLGIHEMTATGKALVAAFYGATPRKAYFNGCSTGGRQGMMEAQRYPADYDGVVAGAPAINWTKLHIEQLWGPLVMLESKTYPAPCKFAAATAAAVAACGKDGVIDQPDRCPFDPKELVGKSTGAACEPFTVEDAAVIRKIWEGPRRADGTFLWYGLTRGADFSGLSRTGGTPLTAQPSGISLDWWKYFLTQNPQWDWTTLNQALYEQMWDQSVEEFGGVIGTDNPDLTAFRDRGGKLILWHGWADQLIYPQGTIDYFKRVEERMGSAAPFARLYLAPGVAHCRGGAGPEPTGQLEALVDWVEKGTAPGSLKAVKGERSRPLCPYPLTARYKGSGSLDEAASFSCAR